MFFAGTVGALLDDRMRVDNASGDIVRIGLRPIGLPGSGKLPSNRLSPRFTRLFENISLVSRVKQVSIGCPERVRGSIECDRSRMAGLTLGVS